MATKWNYGGAIDRHPIHEREICVFDNGGKVKVHNLFDELPDMMKGADVIFCDPPCSKANINSFYTKADRDDHQESYEPFTQRIFECIDQIKPKKLFLEVFKSNKARFLAECQERYQYVTIYETTYYHKKNCICFVIACSNEAPTDHYPFEGMDEENVIEWICEHEAFECIGDLCMGRGLVGLNAYKNNKRFVGTELNKKRLAVLLERITKQGGEYQIMKDEGLG